MRTPGFRSYGGGGSRGAWVDLRPGRSAAWLAGALGLLTLAFAVVPELRPWLVLRGGGLPMPTALLTNTLVAAPSSLFNLLLPVLLLGFFMQDQVRAWWATRRTELLLAVGGGALVMYLLGRAVGVPGLGFGVGAEVLMLLFFGTAVERQFGGRRLLLFSLVVAVAVNAAGALLWWAFPSLHLAAAGAGAAPTFGSHPLTDAYATAWCLMFGYARLAFLNIEARKLVWVLVAINALGFLFTGRLAGLMGGAAIGVSWLLVTGRWRPDVALDRFRLWRLERKHEQRKKRFQVIDGGKTLHRSVA